MKKNKIRNEIIMIWDDTTGSTGTRDTKYDDLESKYHISASNLAILSPTAAADIII